MLSELQASLHETWHGPNATESPPELGPTGKWVYKFRTPPAAEDARSSSSSSSQVYHRCHIDWTATGSVQPETVLEIPMGTEALAMSLTPDENCIAWLQAPPKPAKDNDSSSPHIKLRSIASKMENTLSTREWLGAIANEDDEQTQIVGLEWGPILSHSKGNKDPLYSLYLVLADHQGRPDRVVLYQIDPLSLKPSVPPILIYKSNDPAVIVDVQRTKGCSCVCIRALSKTSNEVFLSPAFGDGNLQLSSLLLVRPRQDGVIYHVEVGTEGDVVLLTSDERQNTCGDYLLEETSASELPLPPSAKQSPSVPENQNSEFFVEDMDLFQSHIVLYERSRKNGDQRIRIRQRADGNPTKADTIINFSSIAKRHQNHRDAKVETRFPLHWSKLSPVGNMFFGARSFRFELESPLAPGLVYEYSFDTQELTMISERRSNNATETMRTPQSDSFQKETVLVESSDGTEVPLSLFFKAENDMSQCKTVVLVGYGAYGEPADLGYNPGLKPLLDRSVVIAFAHTRGGGDLGRAWYASGRKEQKIRSIEDYEACAFYLRKRFAPQTLVAKAFSAGGILVGSAVNRNPGLFDKVILTNAFVDVLSTMSNPSLYLTEHEYDEFGNPGADPILYEIIRSYCPIYNLDPVVQSQQTRTQYLLIGTLDDTNVPYWNASLYFRKLLKGFAKVPATMDGDNATVDTDVNRQYPENNRVFLDLQTDGGHHFSAANRVDVLALENAFILKD